MRFLDIKTTRYLLFVLVITSVLIGVILYVLMSHTHTNEQLSKLENSLNITRNMLEEQKRYALSLSILLSEDKEITQSFLQQNRQESFDIVNRKIQTLKTLQNSHFEVQIHHKNLSTYLRSWDFSKKDIPLEAFRKGLVKVKEEKKPLVSIELGKRLNIKAISPIIIDNEFKGSIEVIINFDYLFNELKQKGFTLFVLLDQTHLRIANELQKNPKIGNYVLVNQANSEKLATLELNDLKDYGYISNKECSFSYFSYYDLSNEHLGYIFTGINNENHLTLHNAFEYTKGKTLLNKVNIQ
ncbi:MAG: cache domain-containing protein [Arcobacteraceae bacterium]